MIVSMACIELHKAISYPFHAYGNAMKEEKQFEQPFSEATRMRRCMVGRERWGGGALSGKNVVNANQC